MITLSVSSGAPHLNINLEMNYWPSLPCDLSECQEPLFDYLSFLSMNGSKTASVRVFLSLYFLVRISLLNDPSFQLF